MKMNKTSVKIMSFVAAAMLMAACGGKKNVQQAGIPVQNNAGPAWVTQGSGAFKDGSFYGVGVATGIKNKALAVDTADSRARAKVAEVFNTYVAKLNKDYMASTTAGDMSASSEEQNVTQTLKTFTQMSLSGATPIDHWQDPSDGSMYSLVKLDMAAVKSTLEQAKQLDAKVRDYVKANADKAFDELTAEEAKH